MTTQIVDIRDLEAVLANEMPSVPALIVSPKGIYNTSDLIERAENYFPGSVRKDMPKLAISDFREVGKCLAFAARRAATSAILTDILSRSDRAPTSRTAEARPGIEVDDALEMAAPPAQLTVPMVRPGLALKSASGCCSSFPTAHRCDTKVRSVLI
jgi:hypothetical protein